MSPCGGAYQMHEGKLAVKKKKEDSRHLIEEQKRI